MRFKIRGRQPIPGLSPWNPRAARMPLTINTNVGSLTAQRNLNAGQTASAVALQRLSSGLRINSARDDAAGLSITDRFTTQIRGLAQAARNASDGVSMLQTAEGALANLTEMMQRIREIAVQAANATNSAADRAALQTEVGQLTEEIERIGSTSSFNGSFIFDSSRTSAVGDFVQLAVLDGLKAVGGWLENSESLIESLFGLGAGGQALSIELTTFSDGAGGTLARVASSFLGGQTSGTGTNLKLQVDLADFATPNLPNGGTPPVFSDRVIAHEMVHAVMAATTNWFDLTQNNSNMWFVEGAAEFIHGADERVAGINNPAAIAAALNDGFQNTNLDYAAGYVATRYLHEQIQLQGGSGIQDVFAYLSADPLTRTLDGAIAATTSFTNVADFISNYSSNGAAFIGTFNLNNSDTGAIGGLDVDGGPVKSAESVVPNSASRSGDDVLIGFSETYQEVQKTLSTGNTKQFQVGANVGETITTQLGAMNLEALGFTNAVNEADDPRRAINAVDRALAYVSSQRAVIGAQISRLESTISNLSTSNENLSAARSRILDADYASETVELTRSQILQQAGVSVLAQASQLPRGVLALLR